jgi:hypothetical protein
MVESIFQKENNSHPKIPIVPHQILMDQWKMTLTWCYHGSCKLFALKLHNSCSYIVVIKLHELHMYIVSHTVSCIYYNSCNLSNSIHTYKNMQSCNEWQMVIVTQKPSCKVNCKSPYFLTVLANYSFLAFLSCLAIKFLQWPWSTNGWLRKYLCYKLKIITKKMWM